MNHNNYGFVFILCHHERLLTTVFIRQGLIFTWRRFLGGGGSLSSFFVKSHQVECFARRFSAAAAPRGSLPKAPSLGQRPLPRVSSCSPGQWVAAALSPPPLPGLLLVHGLPERLSPAHARARARFWQRQGAPFSLPSPPPSSGLLLSSKRITFPLRASARKQLPCGPLLHFGRLRRDPRRGGSSGAADLATRARPGASLAPGRWMGSDPLPTRNGEGEGGGGACRECAPPPPSSSSRRRPRPSHLSAGRRAVCALPPPPPPPVAPPCRSGGSSRGPAARCSCSCAWSRSCSCCRAQRAASDSTRPTTRWRCCGRIRWSAASSIRAAPGWWSFTRPGAATASTSPPPGGPWPPTSRVRKARRHSGRAQRPLHQPRRRLGLAGSRRGQPEGGGEFSWLLDRQGAPGRLASALAQSISLCRQSSLPGFAQPVPSPGFFPRVSSSRVGLSVASRCPPPPPCPARSDVAR